MTAPTRAQDVRNKEIIMRQKLTLITFGVQDLARSLTFYEQGLQWKRSPQSMEHYVLFPLGGIVLGLYPLSSLAQNC